MVEILPIMPALCSMLFNAHYAQTYAGIIGASLIVRHVKVGCHVFRVDPYY